LLTGCLATRQEIEDLRVDIVHLQNTLAKVQSNQGQFQTGQADLSTAMNELNRNLQVLSSQLDETGNRMNMLSTRMDNLDANMSNRLDLLSELLSGNKASVPPSPDTLYKLAYSDFNRRRYSQALQGFQNYIAQYPDTDRTADVQYYVGECHLAMNDYTKALDAYDQVLVKYSTSTVVPSAYVQKGVVLEKAGRPAEALAVYDAVLRKYPYRKEALTAKERMNALRNASPSPVAAPR